MLQNTWSSLPQKVYPGEPKGKVVRHKVDTTSTTTAAYPFLNGFGKIKFLFLESKPSKEINNSLCAALCVLFLGSKDFSVSILHAD